MPYKILNFIHIIMRKSIFALMAFAALALVSCKENKEPEPNPDATKLATPVVTASEQTENSVTVIWEAVENAQSYAYKLDGPTTVEETTTAELTATFTELAAGEYTVSVKAIAPNEDFTDSDYGTLKVTIGSETPGNTLDKPAVTVSGQTENSANVSWDAVENATGYIYKLDGPTTVKETSTTELAAELTGLTAGEYTVSVKATAEGYTDSEWGTADFTIVAGGGSEDTEWIGTWNLSSSHKFQLLIGAGNMLDMAYAEGSVDKTITIEDGADIWGQPGAYAVYGLSYIDASIPAYGEVDAEGRFCLYDYAAVGTDSQGNTQTWVMFTGSDAETGGDLGIVIGGDWVFAFAPTGNTVTSVATEGELSTGAHFVALAMDVVGVPAQGSSVSIYNPIPSDLPAGTLTMTKASSSTANISASAAASPMSIAFKTMAYRLAR